VNKLCVILHKFVHYLGVIFHYALKPLMPPSSNWNFMMTMKPLVVYMKL